MSEIRECFQLRLCYFHSARHSRSRQPISVEGNGIWTLIQFFCGRKPCKQHQIFHHVLWYSLKAKKQQRQQQKYRRERLKVCKGKFKGVPVILEQFKVHVSGPNWETYKPPQRTGLMRVHSSGNRVDLGRLERGKRLCFFLPTNYILSRCLNA